MHKELHTTRGGNVPNKTSAVLLLQRTCRGDLAHVQRSSQNLTWPLFVMLLAPLFGICCRDYYVLTRHGATKSSTGVGTTSQWVAGRNCWGASLRRHLCPFSGCHAGSRTSSKPSSSSAISTTSIASSPSSSVGRVRRKLDPSWAQVG